MAKKWCRACADFIEVGISYL